jgi:chromosome segregation ATPase
MSNELMIVLATSSLAALVGGALVAWFTARQGRAPDPELEGRRELQLIRLREIAEHYRQAGCVAEEQVRTQQAALENGLTHISTLEEQVAAYLRQYAQAKNMLKAEIRQKNLLSTELAAASAQIQSLRGRVQELEMERNAITGSLRRLSA